MKKLISSILGCLISLLCFAQSNDVINRYINNYKDIAISEMYRSGIPASITLAQGILESGAGQSELAVKGNNHFGIKCHKDWSGKRMYFDDDRRNECFRVYKKAEDSFKDHSDFIRYRDRYKFLFDYKITNYKAWAKGLSKAGYATDPTYSKKLISYIETYQLSQYDDTKKIKISKENKNHKSNNSKDKEYLTIPVSPHKLEEKKIYKQSPNANETVYINLSNIYTINDVQCVEAKEGQRLSDIAKNYNLYLSEILAYNDLDKDHTLRKGEIVYIQPKQNQAVKGMYYYIVDKDGQSLWEISQKYAVKLSSLIKMNKLKNDYYLKEGDKLILRKK